MIELPETPAPVSFTARLIDFGTTLVPPLGGAEQRINRSGSKMELSVVMPPMRNKDEGRIFVSKLIQAQSLGLRMKYPLAGLGSNQDPGSPVVRLDGQIGTILRVGGLTPGFSTVEGQPFSVTAADGTSYLHYITRAVNATASGNNNFDVWPPLRDIFNIGDVCEFTNPVIEGLIEGDAREWNISVEHLVGIEFTIRERK